MQQPTETPITLSRIVSAARALVEEKGFVEVSMVDVARAAEVGRATLYRYFSTKEHLYFVVALDWAQRFARHLRGTSLGGATRGARLSSLLREVVAEAREHPRLMAAYVASAVSDDPAVRALEGEVEQLVPALMALALGDCRPRRQGLAESTLYHIMLSNFILMNAGRASAPAVTQELIDVARLLLADVWDEPWD